MGKFSNFPRRNERLLLVHVILKLALNVTIHVTELYCTAECMVMVSGEG